MAEINVATVATNSKMGAAAQELANAGAESLNKFDVGNVVAVSASANVQPFRFSEGSKLKGTNQAIAYDEGLAPEQVYYVHIETGSNPGRAKMFDVLGAVNAANCASCGEEEEQTSPPLIYCDGSKDCGVAAWKALENYICNTPLILTSVSQQNFSIGSNGQETPLNRGINFTRSVAKPGVVGYKKSEQLYFRRQYTQSNQVDKNYFPLTLDSTNHRVDKNIAWESDLIPANTLIILAIGVMGTPNPY